MKWIDINERSPAQEDVVNGRVPILDDEGYIGFAIPMFGGRGVSLLSDYKVAYWLEGVPPAPEKKNV